MNWIFVIVYVLSSGESLSGRTRNFMDWFRSVRYEFALLTLFTVYNLARSAVFMMQARRYKAIMEAAESFIKNALSNQILDESSPDFGGLRCPDLYVCEPWVAVNVFTTMTVLFFNPDSHCYRSSELFQRMKLALQFITRSQYEDGTIDANFSGEMRSSSNAAFAMLALTKAYKLFHREAASGETLDALESFLRKGAGALKNKPLSDASHRWVAASALVEFDRLFLDHAAVVKAENYLSDGININHDGLYGERSPAYSMISNAMLLNIAKKMNRSYLIDYVRRNLNFSLYNFCSNGEIITEYSLKPESETGMPQGYGVWKEMSIVDHNGYYASAGDMVLDIFLKNIRNGCVTYCVNSSVPSFGRKCKSKLFATSGIGELLIMEDEFNNDAIHRLPLPCHYKKVFSDSNIIRIRDGEFSSTIMGNNRTLLSIHNGQAIIDGFRIRYNYYGYRDFLPQKLEVAARSYILRDWCNQWRVGNEEDAAEPAEVALRILAEFIPRNDGFDIDISTFGQKGVPLQLEFGIRKQGSLTANGREYELDNTDLVYVDEGEDAVIKAGGNRLEIRGGLIQHKITSYDDGWLSDRPTTRLMITPLTPFNGRIQVNYSEYDDPEVAKFQESSEQFL